ncbi:hypothetical protein HYFRA_00014034 [Hymenoscyphus fraxineus]|uniref:Heterokaryon incompatibility domain-containing protein n=1 Tax=Hymenoscyphus fraxineus TaxID=746836 RepID=A0A9N9LAC7_9HELO|nr:hypothetical protein HYFRA_00014034 [Hymenoscyphus fraxineus]
MSRELRDEPRPEDRLPESRTIDQKHDDIQVSTERCAILLQSCSSSPTLSENYWAQSRLDDLKLWSAGIGATAPGHASLEWRLRSRSDIKEVVLGFLGELIEKVSNCLAHAEKAVLNLELRPIQLENIGTNTLEEKEFSENSSDPSGTISPWSELSDTEDVDQMETWPPQDFLKFEMKGAEVLLAQLARLSLVIRKAGAQLRWQRADVQFEEFRSRCVELRGKMDCTSLWTPLRDDISAVYQRLFQFRRRLEYSFVWNSYQEDIDPYKELLFRRFTSNEVIRHVFPGSSKASLPTAPRNLRDLTPDERNTVEKWLLSLDDEDRSSTELELDLHRISNSPTSTHKPNTHEYARQSIPEYHSNPLPWPTTVMRKFLTDPNRISAIQQRLLNANVKRRNRFEVARQNVKPFPPREPVVAELIPQPARTEKLPVQTPTIVEQHAAPTGDFKAKAPTVTKTVESATELGSQLQLPDTKLLTSSKITVVSGRGAKMKYPRRPQIDGDRRTFQCPYCYQVLPVIYAKEGWRAHVAQDLQPYSCVLDNCPVPDQLFGSSKEWSNHMEQAHSSDRWMCYVCGDDKPLVFESSAGYKQHLLESKTHADSFTEAQLPLLIANGRTPVVSQLETCPICQWSEQHANFHHILEKQSNTGQNRALTIEDHVAEHLHSFSLQALPDLEDNDTDSLQLSTGSVENNLRLLKQTDVDKQYSFSERRAAFRKLGTHVQEIMETMNALDGIFIDPHTEELLSIIWRRALHGFWVPYPRHMHNIETIQSALYPCLKEDVEKISEVLSQIFGHFSELSSDIISEMARSRWRRIVRSSHRPGRFQHVVELFMGKYMTNTPLLSRSHSTFVGTLVEELVDGRCIFCNAIVRFLENIDLNIKHADLPFHPSLIGVRSSANLGCRLCVVFLEAIDKKYSKRLYYESENSLDSSNAPREDRAYVPSFHNLLPPIRRFQFSRVVRSILMPRNFHVVFAQDRHGAKTLQLASRSDHIQIYDICCARDDYLATCQWTTAYTSTENPLSQTSISLIRYWQDSCSRQHTVCHQSAAIHLPRRLLKIEDSGDLRLVLFGADTGEVPYCALSYCWGNYPALKLLSENLEDMMRHISAKAMSKTHRDAVLLARALGHQYIWIDALCVVQDSQEDWGAESSRFLDYYENSILTIAVAGVARVAGVASLSDDGFLNVFANPDLTEHILVEARQDMESPRREWQHALHIRAQSDDRDNDYPLYERSWAFQELLLSPRLLVLQSKSIVWCCDSLICYDTGTTQIPRFWKSLSSVRGQLATGTMTESSICSLWLTIVEFYSGLSTTHSFNRLHAISGLAERLARLVSLHYAAGIWQEDIVRGLLWFSESGHPRNQAATSKDYIAPTWSWASLGDKVSFNLPWSANEISHLQKVAELLDVNIMYDPEFCTVRGGHITLRAPAVGLQAFRDLAGHTYKLDTDDSTKDDDLGDVLFLACVKLVIKSSRNWREHWVGLALKPITSSEQYRRIGRLEGIIVDNSQRQQETQHPIRSTEESHDSMKVATFKIV